MECSTKTISTTIIAALVGAGIGYFACNRGVGCCSRSRAASIQEEHCKLRRGLDRLWADHVVWTRNYIIAAVAGTPDAKVVAERLFKNQDDLGNAIVPFYGAEAGAQLAKLLREHIQIAAEIIPAAKEKDDAKVKELSTKWHENASAIAAFLSAANPENWTKDALENMLNEHLKLTTQEVVDRIEQKWAEDINNFDKIFDQAMMMSKDLADGIAKQKNI